MLINRTDKSGEVFSYEIPELSHGDRLVITTEKTLKREQIDAVRKGVQDFLSGDKRALILCDGFKVSAVLKGCSDADAN